MAKAIPLVLGVAAIAVTGGAALGLIAPLTATLITTGLGVVGSLAGALLAEGPAKPQMADGDVSVAQAIPPRVRVYGRSRRSGAFLFYDSTPDGDLKILYQLAAHECAAFEEDWLNDERVQRDGDGNVTDDPYWQEDNDDSAVVIQHYLGTPTQVIPSFDEKWTADHKGHGLCCAYVKYADLKAEEQANTFGGSAPPYRAVLLGAKIFDPRDVAQDVEDEATYAWSDNSALVILDYLTRLEQGIPVGFGFSFDSIDLASFAAAADVCDQEIPKKDGGIEKRWRTWAAYELTEERKAVLSDLLDACCGRLIQGPDGRLGLTVGADRYRALAEDAYTVPAGIPASSVTLNDDQILEYDFSTGKAAIERINEVRAIYVSQAWEWAETEAGIQEDVAGQARNGVESSQIKLRFVPSEGQAQRIARYTLRHGGPKRSGRIRTTLAGLDAWGERWITLTISEIVGFTNVLCEINTMRIDRVSMTVEMEVTSYDDWWTWTAATDEADPAVPPPDTDEDNDVPVPENVAVSIAHRSVNGQFLQAVGVITWDPPPRSVYSAKARYRVVQPDPEADPFPWQPLPVAQDDQQVETFPLADGTAYEAQVRFIGPAGAGGDWSDLVPFTAVADPVAPASPVLLSATPAGSNVNLSATAANSSNQSLIRFWRDSDATFAGAIDISGPIWTGPNGIATFTDTPGLGAWRYWATAGNWSGIESAPAGPQAVTFTPAAPVITAPTTPYVTSDNTPTFSGTAPNTTTVHLFDGATDVGSVAVVAGAWTITASTLADGTRNVTAKAVAAGGATSAASNTVVTTIDTVVSPPVITTSSPLSTTDTTPDISGTSEIGAAIAMFRGGSTPAGSATANGSGNWTATLSPALAIGSYSITAKQTDLAGNVSGASTALTLNVQPVAPAITTVGATTYDKTPTIAGTSTASATIKLYDDGVLSATSTADGSGNWSFPTGVLAVGANVITATQTVSGIESPASSGITMTVSALDTDAAAIIGAMTTEPTSARMGLINTLVTALKTAGVWTKLDRLFILAAADSQASLLDWKAHATKLTATTATTAPTFTADRGWQGGGSGTTVGGYLAGEFSATVGTNQLAQDSAHLAVWNHLASTGSGAGTFREAGGGQTLIACKNSTAVLWCQANATGADTPTQAGDGTGFYAWSRQIAASYHAYQDTNDLGSVTRTSAVLAGGTFHVLRGGSGFSNARVSAACWGAGLSGTEITALRNALHDYLVGVGAA